MEDVIDGRTTPFLIGALSGLLLATAAFVYPVGGMMMDRGDSGQGIPANALEIISQDYPDNWNCDEKQVDCSVHFDREEMLDGWWTVTDYGPDWMTQSSVSARYDLEGRIPGGGIAE